MLRPFRHRRNVNYEQSIQKSAVILSRSDQDRRRISAINAWHSDQLERRLWRWDPSRLRAFRMTAFFIGVAVPRSCAGRSPPRADAPTL